MVSFTRKIFKEDRFEFKKKYVQEAVSYYTDKLTEVINTFKEVDAPFVIFALETVKEGILSTLSKEDAELLKQAVADLRKAFGITVLDGNKLTPAEFKELKSILRGEK